MTDLPVHHGLNCDCCTAQALAASDPSVPVAANDDRATSTTTDLRKSRQRARSVIRDLMDEIIAWLGSQELEEMFSGPRPDRAVNQAITKLARERLREDLVSWLDERHGITMGRGARQAFDVMQKALPDADRDDFRDSPEFNDSDRELRNLLKQVDAGLLYDDDDSLAEEIGNDITRQLRLGLEQDEPVETDKSDQRSLADRVRYVMDEGDSNDRQEAGVTGQTKRTKAELIAHDSVQDAYNTAARKRYLRNGFRYGVFDATMDTKTTDLCRRMNEKVIDMMDTPWFIPPLHPYCRSGIRPILDVEDRQILTEDDVADGFLQTIMSTKSYRPPVLDPDEFQPTPLSREHGHA